MDRLLLRRRIRSSKLDTTDAIVDHLRSQYTEYSRLKRQSLAFQVNKALPHLNNWSSGGTGEGDEKTMQKRERSHLAQEDEQQRPRRKLKHKRHGHPTAGGLSSSSLSSSSLFIPNQEDEVFDAKSETEFDLIRTSMREKYRNLTPSSKRKRKQKDTDAAPESIDGSEILGARMPQSNGEGGVGMERYERRPKLTDYTGMPSLLRVLSRKVLLPLSHPELLARLGTRPKTGILLHGPPGCGKTRLAHAIANTTGLPFYEMSSTELLSGVPGESEENIKKLFTNAKRSAPSIVFIDEIDIIASKREDLQRESDRRIVTQLMACIDESRKSSMPESAVPDLAAPEKKPGYVLVIGATNRPGAIDPALRRPGRFDVEILMDIPDEKARHEILVSLSDKLRFDGSVDLLKIARSTPGFVAADLKELLDEAVGLAAERLLSSWNASSSIYLMEDIYLEKCREQAADPGNAHNINTTMTDLEEALKQVKPSLTREGFSPIPSVNWDDVGGLHSIRKELNFHIVERIKSPELYEKFGIPSKAGFLLYGPPGCGKTLIAKAVANASGANFIYIKGPELLSKYVGESESSIRALFNRARACSPSILFFDEVDALTTKRGRDSGRVVESVVNQLLLELDGEHERHGVYVIAATNRREAIDPAIRRSGRLGKELYVPLPSPEDRVLILKALTRKRPLAANVDFDVIGHSEYCKNFNGADLAEVVDQAAAAAMNEAIELLATDPKNPELWTIKLSHFELAVKQVSSYIKKKHFLGGIESADQQVNNFDVLFRAGSLPSFGKNPGVGGNREQTTSQDNGDLSNFDFVEIERPSNVAHPQLVPSRNCMTKRSCQLETSAEHVCSPSAERITKLVKESANPLLVAINLLNEITEIEKKSEEWLFAASALRDEPTRHLFIALGDPEARCAWIKHMYLLASCNSGI